MIIIIFININYFEISYILACFDMVDHKSASNIITKNESQLIIKNKELDLIVMSINIEPFPQQQLIIFDSQLPTTDPEILTS